MTSFRCEKTNSYIIKSFSDEGQVQIENHEINFMNIIFQYFINCNLYNALCIYAV